MAKRIFILGAGRFGTHLATRLSEFGCEIVLGDNNGARVKDLAEDGFHTLEMDANDEDALRDSGALTADVVVVAIGENMQASILATLLLKQLRARHVVARALDAKHAQVLERLGADEVILPVRDMAYRLAENLRDGTEGERIPVGGDFVLAEVAIGAALAGRTLAEARLGERFEVTPLLWKQLDKGRVAVAPVAPELRLAAGGALLVLGRRDDVRRFEREVAARG